MHNVDVESLPERRPEMDFTLVRNGMDYLSSAVLYLTGKIQVPMDAQPLWPEVARGSVFAQPAPLWLSDRHLKYGVLHLQAAVEVLLKARLVREHWCLVFADPLSATRTSYEQGTFRSCDTNTTLDRLTQFANVPITVKQRRAITSLAETRNALTHYGHTGSAYAVEARAAHAMSFLIDFVSEYLHPALSREAGIVVETMNAVRTLLKHIDKLVEKRMQDLVSKLAPLAAQCVRCPACLQLAFVVGRNDEPPNCYFCLQTFETAAEAATYYWEDVLGADDFSSAKDCPQCGTWHSVMMVSTAATPETDAPLCFHCGAAYQEKA